jgi:hypothetical protein
LGGWVTGYGGSGGGGNLAFADGGASYHFDSGQGIWVVAGPGDTNRLNGGNSLVPNSLWGGGVGGTSSGAGGISYYAGAGGNGSNAGAGSNGSAPSGGGGGGNTSGGNGAAGQVRVTVF